MNTPYQIDLKIIETYLVSGVWAFLNPATKEAFVSYSSCVLQGVIRQHKKYVGWECRVIVTATGEKALKTEFIKAVKQLEREGYKIKSKKLNYKIRGCVSRDWRLKEPPYTFLYYVWLSTKNYDIEPLAVFRSAIEGEKFVKELKQAGDYKVLDNELTNEYRKIWKDLEFNAQFRKNGS